MARPIYLTKALTSASTTAICASQTPLAAGNLLINGGSASGGVATLDTQRRVLLTFAGDETGRTFVVYGTNEGKQQIQETIAGTTVSAVTTLDFKTVTQISISTAAAGAITVGTNGVGSTPWQNVNYHLADINVGVSIAVTGTINYTAQTTMSDFWSPVNPTPGTATPIPVATDDPVLTGETASGDTNFDGPITGWRVTVNSGSGSLAIAGIQAGIING